MKADEEEKIKVDEEEKQEPIQVSPLHDEAEQVFYDAHN